MHVHQCCGMTPAPVLHMPQPSLTDTRRNNYRGRPYWTGLGAPGCSPTWSIRSRSAASPASSHAPRTAASSGLFAVWSV